MKTSHNKIYTIMVAVGIAAVSTQGWALAEKNQQVTASSSREAWLSQMSVLVADERGDAAKFRSEMCPMIVGIAKQVAKNKKATISCGEFKPNEFYSQEPNKDRFVQIDKNHAVNILLWRDIVGDWHLYTANSLLSDPTDIRQAEWKVKGADLNGDGTINGADGEEAKKIVQRLLINVFAYYQNLRGIKEFNLINGLEESTKVKQIAPHQFARVDNGQKLTFDEAYDLYISESARTKHYLAAGLEIALLLGYGVYWYYANHDLNKVDWEYGSRHTILDRLKTDDNSEAINIKHAYAGSAYFLAARLSGLGYLESQLAAFAASSIWEWQVERKEVFSINDTFVTSVGGSVMGEAAYQVGRRVWNHFAKMSNQKLMNAYGSGGFFDKLRQNFADFTRQDLRGTGLDFDMPGRTEIGLAAFKPTHNDDSSEIRYYFDAEGYNIPQMRAAGNAKRTLAGTSYYRVLVEATKDPKAVDTFNMITEVALSGYFYKVANKSPTGDLRRFSVMIAPAQAFNMNVGKMGVGEYEDMVVNVGVVGSTLHLEGEAKGVSYRIIMSVYGDFGMVQSYDFASYAKNYDVSGAPSVVRNYDYYYAGGVTGAVRMNVNYGPFEIGSGITQDRFQSTFMNSYRDQDKITFNPVLRDQQTQGEVYGKATIAKTANLKCGLSFRERAGSVNGTTYSDEPAKMETYQYCAVTYLFN